MIVVNLKRWIFLLCKWFSSTHEQIAMSVLIIKSILPNFLLMIKTLMIIFSQTLSYNLKKKEKKIKIASFLTIPNHPKSIHDNSSKSPRSSCLSRFWPSRSHLSSTQVLWNWKRNIKIVPQQGENAPSNRIHVLEAVCKLAIRTNLKRVDEILTLSRSNKIIIITNIMITIINPFNLG